MSNAITQKITAIIMIIGLIAPGISLAGPVIIVGYNDTETSSANTFSATTLDFSLTDTSDNPLSSPLFNISAMQKEESQQKIIRVKNDGNLDFQYKINLENVSGDLCSYLTLQAQLDGDPLEYNAKVQNTTFPLSNIVYSSPNDDWTFTLTLSNDAPENKTCDFDLTFNGTQIGGAGFSDTETISNTVTSGTWGQSLLPVAGFAVFGASDVSDTDKVNIGNSTSVFIGLVGSNRSINMGGSTFSEGIRAGGNVSVGNNSNIGGDGVIANGSVTLGGSVKVYGEINGASISIGNSADIYNNVFSGGSFSIGGSTQVNQNVDAYSATLGNNAKIIGTLTLPNGVLPTLGGGATVGTLVNDGTPLTAPDTFNLITLPSPNTFSANTDAGFDISITSGNSPLNLPPGIYRNLTSNNSVTLNLSAGTYVFKSIDFGGSNNIYADVSAGKILIFVEGNVTAGNSTQMNVIGGTAEDIYLESGGIVTLGGSNKWYGTIYSTKSDNPGQFGIITGNNTDVWGALYSAQQISLGGSNNITLVGPFFGTYTEPDTVAEVVLNEIYANPNSVDSAPDNREWIELYNNSGTSVDVLGWKISEMSGTSETFYTIVSTCSGSLSGKIAPYGGASTVINSNNQLLLQFCPTSQVLNNDGDTVRLYDNSNTFLDGHAYPNTIVGKSHQRIPNGVGLWVDPEPTPGEPNRASMQDLIDAGLGEEAIQRIIALLAERGETLLEDKPEDSSVFVKEESEQGLLDQIVDAIVEEILPEETPTEETSTTEEQLIEELATPETPIVEEKTVVEEQSTTEEQLVIENAPANNEEQISLPDSNSSDQPAPGGDSGSGGDNGGSSAGDSGGDSAGDTSSGASDSGSVNVSE